MKVSKIQSSKLIQLVKKRKDSDKESPSTAAPNSPGNCSESDFKSQEGLWTLNYDNDQIDQMRMMIDGIEEQQEEMKNKFDKIVQFLIEQVSKNNQENRKLVLEVKSLKKDVEECSKDIFVIQSIIQPTLSRVKPRHQERHEGPSIDKMHVRNLSKSKSRGLLVSTKSSERIYFSKRISGKGSKCDLNHRI